MELRGSYSILLTLTCTAPRAPEIGSLLGKNPASVFAREFSAGIAWVFYPEVAEDQVTVALLTEIDPVGLVRGPVTLEGEQTVRNVLGHLYVLLPVLDNTKHYWVGADEADKLLAHGGAWLAAHPARALIAQRYLRYPRPLITSALARLAEHDPEVQADAAETEVADEAVEVIGAENVGAADPKAPSLGLHEQRLAAVMEAVRACRARSLADLGCGEGRLLALALKERSLTRIFGMDVSTVALARACRRVHYETLPAAQQARIEITQGSLLYRDARLAGFDAAALVEVIERLDAARLSALEQVVFEHARPRRVIVTTPNREYNVHWEALGAERLRHGDHRFEWTRAECRAWAERVATTHGYTVTWQDVGPVDGDLGAPSQMIIFDRADGANHREDQRADEGMPSDEET